MEEGTTTGGGAEAEQADQKGLTLFLEVDEALAVRCAGAPLLK